MSSIGRGNEKLCFLFQSDKNSGCYGNLKFPYTYNGKSGNLYILFFSLNEDIWILFLQKCLLISPLHFIRLLIKSMNLIGCQGHKKGLFSQKC